MIKKLSACLLALSIVHCTNAVNMSDIKICVKKINFEKVGWKLIVAAACVYAIYKTYSVWKFVKNHPSKIAFDWDNIDIDAKKMDFNKKCKDKKEPFLWAVATSAYQVEGEQGATVKPYNQWQRCEGKAIDVNGELCKPVPHISGNACEHWTRYKEDIDLLKKLGFNSFRISVSWGKIEPKEGVFSTDALDHYEDVCKYMVKQGIKPIVTLHHYIHPCWFEDKGGFEKEENIDYFVNFCKKVFTQLKDYVHLWFSFNTFTGYAMAGYSQAMKPPFKKSLSLAFIVFKHMLESHTRVYYALKDIDKKAKIGIYKNIFQVDPWNLLNPLDIFYSSLANKISNTSVYNYFKTGIFEVSILGKTLIRYENKNAIGALDMVGLNYYSGSYVKNFKVIPRLECIATENERYTIYPEGFYRALVSISSEFTKPLGKIKNKEIPIYVTENGIAACKDSDRDLFYKRYLHVLYKAMGEGVDVRGYTTWSLMDNYEWALGYNVKYGICHVDFETQKRTLKKGTEFLLNIINM